MEQHAILSASSSHRWLHCTPSARLAAQFPDAPSVHAEAGRLAHALAELKARKHFVEPMGARTYNSRMKKLKLDPNYEPKMDGATDEYLEHLKSLAMSFAQGQPFVALETRVPLDDYIPQGFGTADCIMIGEGRLCVVDYKNGAGVAVEAEHNSQMMLYALGALSYYTPIYGDTIRDIHLSIVQPHAGGIKTWELSRRELEEWGATVVRPAAALAWDGGGDFCPGPWCDKAFCPARATCTARARKMLEMEPLKGAVPEASPHVDGDVLLTDAQVGDVLARAIDLEAWVKSLKIYAETALLSGKPIPGWKMVETKRTRSWKDGADAAFPVLIQRGLDEAMLYKRDPLTPPALEKSLGKKVYAETMEDLVVWQPGKPTLKPESDPRPPYRAADAAFQKVDGDG